jgi:flagellin FlaB
MFNHLHRDESGQTALETAIILIAFIVVASVFAFTILSAGSASTEAGEEAIYSGLEGVQSSMDVRGTIMAEDAGTDGSIDSIVLRLTLVAGGQPVDLDPAGDVVISYTDNSQFINSLTYTLAWVGANDGDDLLEGDEQAELTIDVSGATLGANTDFNIEIVPPDGAVLTLDMNTPAALEAWNALR